MMLPQKAKENGIFYLISFLLFILFFILLPVSYNSSWRSSSDFHSCIEITSSLIAMVSGIASIIYFGCNHKRFYLLVGLGFFISGGEDLIHGILSFERLVGNSGVDFSRFIPVTYVAGRSTLAILIIVAPAIDSMVGESKSIKKEALAVAVFALLLGSIATIVAFLVPLPKLIFPDNLIARPADFVSAIFFAIALVIVLKRFFIQKDIFSEYLIYCIILNLGGQVYMSFSKNLFDIYFDIAHFANILSYLMPLIGISLQNFHETQNARKANNTLEEHLRALEVANSDLEKFTYLASHDLRSPLRGIASIVEWLEEDFSVNTSGECKAYMELLKGRVQRMQNLLDDLLIYNKAGAESGNVEAVNIKEMVEKIISESKTKAEIQLKCIDLPVIKTISSDIKQIFEVLINNAIKHNDKECIEVQVSAKNLGSFMEFEVKDNGPGIPVEFHTLIFEAFKTLRSRDEVEGSGIGLAIAKKILDKHKLWIKLESEEKRGSRFYFLWPIIIKRGDSNAGKSN